MPAYSKERTKEHINLIRRVLVMNPDASLLDIRLTLQKQPKNPITLHKDYINKLVKKIHNERANRYNNYTINKILTDFQDTLRETDRRLWAMLTSSEVPHNVKVSAIKELRNNKSELLERMFNAGIFTKKIGEMDLNIPIDEIIAKINKETGNQFNWQSNKGLKNYKANVTEKPTDSIKENGSEQRSPEDSGDTGEGQA